MAGRRAGRRRWRPRWCRSTTARSGPLADGLTLGQIGLADRLCELDFEIPLAGGDVAPGIDVSLADVGALLDRHLAGDDPLRPYAARLQTPALGGQSLRGYLSGSIDVVLRVPGPDGPRYLVADYKTNWLGPADQPLTAAAYARPRLVEAMLHSDYPLQALLYVVVVHRYLRWRQPGYDPAQPPRRRPLPLRPRHVRSRDPRGGRPPGRRLLLAAAGRAGDRAVRPPGRSLDDAG